MRALFIAIGCLLVFSSLVSATFIQPTDDDDSSVGGSPLSASFDLTTDARSRSEMPTDPKWLPVVHDPRYGLGEWPDDPIKSSNTSSDASHTTAVGAAAVICAIMLVVM